MIGSNKMEKINLHLCNSTIPQKLTENWELQKEINKILTKNGADKGHPHRHHTVCRKKDSLYLRPLKARQSILTKQVRLRKSVEK